MQLGLSESLSTLVARRFTVAKDGGHLIFSPTQLSNIQTAGIPFQLRYCPALAKKPSATPKPTDEGQGHDQSQNQPKTQKPDPFDNPSADLLISNVPVENASYRLVLNKFPVIPNHFILATKEWKSQTDLLEREDLEATYACIKAWSAGDNWNEVDGKGRRRLFAFFNSGPESGASQPHRHIQFLPVEAMAEQENDGNNKNNNGSSWKPLIDAVIESQPGTNQYHSLDHLPFAHFALPIPTNPTPETLHHIYITLYKAAVTTTSKYHDPNGNHADLHIPTFGHASISHNLAMTETAMMICPRKNETADIPLDKSVDGGNGEVAGAGVIALNGTILAATLMVKAQAEWNELRKNPEVLSRAFEIVGYPGTAGRGVASL